MKKVLLMLIFAFLGTALAAAGKAPGIPCETTTYDATQRAVTITCPPSYAFAPLRVQLTLDGIDAQGWKNIDLAPSQPVEMISSRAGHVELRLPYQKGFHRWFAWRVFHRVVQIRLFPDYLTPARAKRPSK
jgi:hypothetical protein